MYKKAISSRLAGDGFFFFGWDTLTKKVVYTLGKKSYGMVRNFDPKNVITTVRGKKVPTLSGKIRNIRVGSESSEESENIFGSFANFFVYS